MFFFFFQAEDGIRDTSVTGVQTCALPIYAVRLAGLFLERLPRLAQAPEVTEDRQGFLHPYRIEGGRSEERRVGKECRGGGAGDEGKKKKKTRRLRIEEE